MADQFLRLVSAGTKLNKPKFSSSQDRGSSAQVSASDARAIHLEEVAAAKRAEKLAAERLKNKFDFFGLSSNTQPSSRTGSTPNKGGVNAGQRVAKDQVRVGTVRKRDEAELDSSSEDDSDGSEMDSSDEEMSEEGESEGDGEGMDDEDGEVDDLDEDLEDMADEDEEDGYGDEFDDAEDDDVEAPLTIEELMRRHDIHVRGRNVPRLLTDFTQMKGRIRSSERSVSNSKQTEDDEQVYNEYTGGGAPAYIIRKLLAPIHVGGLGFIRPTPIQMQCVPALACKREVLAIAPTGSGKTVAYVLPLLTVVAARERKDEERVITAAYKNAITQAEEKLAGTKTGETKNPNNNNSNNNNNKNNNTKNSKSPQTTATAPTNKPVITASPPLILPIRGLILAPTRELASQIYRVVKSLTSAPLMSEREKREAERKGKNQGEKEEVKGKGQRRKAYFKVDWSKEGKKPGDKGKKMDDDDNDDDNGNSGDDDNADDYMDSPIPPKWRVVLLSSSSRRLLQKEVKRHARIQTKGMKGGNSGTNNTNDDESSDDDDSDSDSDEEDEDEKGGKKDEKGEDDKALMKKLVTMRMENKKDNKPHTQSQQHHQQQSTNQPSSSSSSSPLLTTPSGVSIPSSWSSLPTYTESRSEHRQVLITTPMRLVQLILSTGALLPLVKMVILDEADRLLEMGFIHQVRVIIINNYIVL